MSEDSSQRLYEYLTPVQVQGLQDVQTVSNSGRHALALRADGTVWGWGSNLYGQLGDGTQLNQATLVQVTGLTDVVSISAGVDHSLALRADCTMVGWGANDQGQLANGESPQHFTPVRTLLPCRFKGHPSHEHHASGLEQCHVVP
ncbi:RCC1 domain-containing protein [Archangium violaceum]|uniref:RCC1 domain-containing protein n=1 Tax=Archangium violaceum TaxID=83451 RepID=UPI0036DB7402